MGVPDIIAGPSQILGVLAGSTAEFLQRIGDIFVVFGQMGVEHCAFVAGKQGCIPHQFAADRKRGARGNPDPQHRAFGWVVEAVHHIAAVFEDCDLIFNEAVGGQAAVAFSDAHGASGRMEADADLAGPVDAVGKRAAAGVKVEVIRGERASGKCEFAQTECCREPHVVGREAGPNRVEGLQPSKQERVLSGGNGAGEGLVEVVVGVDEARCDDAAPGIDNVIGRGGKIGSDRFDLAVFCEKAALFDLPPVVVHSDEHGCV